MVSIRKRRQVKKRTECDSNKEKTPFQNRERKWLLVEGLSLKEVSRLIIDI